MGSDCRPKDAENDHKETKNNHNNISKTTVNKWEMTADSKTQKTTRKRKKKKSQTPRGPKKTTTKTQKNNHKQAENNHFVWPEPNLNPHRRSYNEVSFLSSLC